MKELILDFKKLNTKEKLFKYLLPRIEELYGSNYDALIDALSFYKAPLTIQIKNPNMYEDIQELLEVFQIIQNENSNINIK